MHQRSLFVRRLAARFGLAAIVGAALAGCGESETTPPGPGNPLVGDWQADHVGLTASNAQVILQQPCAEADFGPLVLDDSLHFEAVSTRYNVTGNIRTYPDEQLWLTGVLDAQHNLHLTLLPVSDSLAGVDPYALDLMPGRLGGTPVCNAAATN